MPQLIAGNWKMNGLRADSLALCEALRAGTRGLACHLLVCPPATVLAQVAQALGGTPIGVGGQDCAPEPAGAHTGDISAGMLRDAGANFVILGHSERRHGHGETSTQVRAKADAARRAGLTPIICVGETEAERDAGRAREVVGAQVAESLPAGFAGVLAYEPVWAIGTGRTAGEDDVAAMHAYIRQQAGAGIPILYGGSVKPGNAAALLAVPEVGGALVGGASLIAADFLAIARAAQPLARHP
jgi:triosephosphate isomerase